MQSCKGGSQSSHSDLPFSYLRAAFGASGCVPGDHPRAEWEVSEALSFWRHQRVSQAQLPLLSLARPGVPRPRDGLPRTPSAQQSASSGDAPSPRRRPPPALPAPRHLWARRSSVRERRSTRGEAETGTARRELSQERSTLRRRGVSATLQRSPIERGQPRGISKYKSAQNTIFMG